MITRQQQILKGMVAVFVFCQCFTIVADVYELICTLGKEQCDYNVHIENLINVAHLMLALNASVNFIFYMMNIDNFKESFIQVKISKNTTSYKTSNSLNNIYCGRSEFIL